MLNFEFKADKKRKYLIIIGAVLFVLTVYKYLAAPLIVNVAGVGEEISVKEKMLGSYRDALGEEKDLESRISLIKKESARLESGLLRGKTPTLATVDIQGILKKMVEESGVEVKTMKILEPEDNGYYKALSVQFTFTSGIKELRDILYRIEKSISYLTIRKIGIRSRRKGRRSLENREINSTLTITGYMKKPK